MNAGALPMAGTSYEELHATCINCGAPIKEQFRVFDSGWVHTFDLKQECHETEPVSWGYGVAKAGL